MLLLLLLLELPTLGTRVLRKGELELLRYQTAKPNQARLLRLE